MFSRLFGLALTTLALLLPNLSEAQVPPTTALQARTYTVAGPGPQINLNNSPTIWHVIKWTPAATNSACTVSAQSSPDAVVWSTLIAGADCTTAGFSAPVSLSTAFVRVNVTVLTVAGAGSVNVVYSGYATNPGGGGGVTCVGCTTGSIPKSNGTNLTNSALKDGVVDGFGVTSLNLIPTSVNAASSFWVGDASNAFANAGTGTQCLGVATSFVEPQWCATSTGAIFQMVGSTQWTSTVTQDLMNSSSNWLFTTGGGTNFIQFNGGNVAAPGGLFLSNVASAVKDTKVSRVSAGVVGIGTGTLGAVDAELQAKKLTLTAGGVLTFPDATTMTTAATGGGGSSIYPAFVLPVIANFSTLTNWTSALTQQTDRGTAVVSVDALHLQGAFRTNLTAPYTFDVAMTATLTNGAGENDYGIAIRNSAIGSGTWHQIWTSCPTASASCSIKQTTLTSEGGIGGGTPNFAINSACGATTFYRIENDSTTVTFAWSCDGKTFNSAFTETSAGFTPDTIGFTFYDAGSLPFSVDIPSVKISASALPLIQP